VSLRATIWMALSITPGGPDCQIANFARATLAIRPPNRWTGGIRKIVPIRTSSVSDRIRSRAVVLVLERRSRTRGRSACIIPACRTWC
jgi:hypothetical protein